MTPQGRQRYDFPAVSSASMNHEWTCAHSGAEPHRGRSLPTRRSGVAQFFSLSQTLPPSPDPLPSRCVKPGPDANMKGQWIVHGASGVAPSQRQHKTACKGRVKGVWHKSSTN